MDNPSSRIITYCHIGKVGGKRLQFYLRSHFGISYRCVDRAKGRTYSRRELESDLRWNPFIKYLGGHSVRPHVDYGPIGRRLEWFSFFRNPLTRVLSHYYQQTASPNFKVHNLIDWLTRYPNRAYWQIYMIAGEKDLAKAKDIISTNYSFVGLNEHYEQSLFLFAKNFGLNGFQFMDGASLPKPEKSVRYHEIVQDFETHQDDIRELLHEELEFYDFVTKIYGEQCDRYGTEKLTQDLCLHLKNTRPLHRYSFNNVVASNIDRFIWRPKTRLSQLWK